MTVAEQIQALKDKVGILEDQIVTLLAEIEFLERPPAPPPPLPEFIATHHDKIPVPGGLNVWAVKGGLWSDPATWNTKKIPTATDRVRIPVGVMVTMDEDCVCDVLVVDGACIWAPEAERTTLTLATLFGMPSGQFVCGLDIAPFEGSFTCLFRPAPPDPLDPARYFGGLVWLGEFTVMGKPKDAYAELSRDVLPGEKILNVFVPPVGWEKGDSLIVHDSRQLSQKERPLGYNQIERCSVLAVLKSVAIENPIAFAHSQGRDDAGNADVPLRIANLTRNVVFKAEVPGTVHCMFTSHPKVDIRYAAFVGLGVAPNEKLNEDPKKGPVVRARYPLHFHHMHTPFHLEGCVVDGGDAPHDRKFGIVLHDTHYSTIKDCVVYNVMGSGIYQEVGNEWGSEITGNTVIRVGGKGGRVDARSGEGTQGTGYWISGPGCRWIDNHAANCVSYGHTVTFFYLGEIAYPDAPSSHTLIKADGNAIGIAAFERSTSFACMSGGTNWWTGTYGNKPRPNAKETVFKDFTAVNCWEYAWFQYPCCDTTFENFKTRGNGTALGIYGADYTAIRLRVKNPDMQGLRTGWSVSSNDGPQLLEGGLISAASCVNLNPPWTNGPGADGIFPREVTIRGTVLKGKALISRFFPAPSAYGGRTQNLVVPDVVRVEDFQGKKGDDFKVYLLEQAPGFVVPKTIVNPAYPQYNRMTACPEAGLTNAAALKKHGVCVGGELATCSTRRAGILGLACPTP